MEGVNESNSGGRHPAVLTSDANAADRPLCVVDVNAGVGSGGVSTLCVPPAKNSDGRHHVRFVKHLLPLRRSDQEKVSLHS